MTNLFKCLSFTTSHTLHYDHLTLTSSRIANLSGYLLDHSGQIEVKNQDRRLEKSIKPLRLLIIYT